MFTTLITGTDVQSHPSPGLHFAVLLVVLLPVVLFVIVWATAGVVEHNGTPKRCTAPSRKHNLVEAPVEEGHDCQFDLRCECVIAECTVCWYRERIERGERAMVTLTYVVREIDPPWWRRRRVRRARAVFEHHEDAVHVHNVMADRDRYEVAVAAEPYERTKEFARIILRNDFPTVPSLQPKVTMAPTARRRLGRVGGTSA